MDLRGIGRIILLQRPGSCSGRRTWRKPPGRCIETYINMKLGEFCEFYKSLFLFGVYLTRNEDTFYGTTSDLVSAKCNLWDEIHSLRLATQDVQIRYFKTAEDITTNELSVYSSTADPYAFTKLSPSELPIFLDIGANIGYHWLCFQLHFGGFHLTSFGKSRNTNLPIFRVSKTTD